MTLVGHKLGVKYNGIDRSIALICFVFIRHKKSNLSHAKCEEKSIQFSAILYEFSFFNQN